MYLHKNILMSSKNIFLFSKKKKLCSVCCSTLRVNCASKVSFPQNNIHHLPGYLFNLCENLQPVSLRLSQQIIARITLCWCAPVSLHKRIILKILRIEKNFDCPYDHILQSGTITLFLFHTETVGLYHVSKAYYAVLRDE